MIERVGPYEIVRQIGRGGMAVVYLARQPALARNVALKELAQFGVGDESLAQRFLREARLAGSLNHPNVVTVFDFLEHDGTPYIAMEYLERGSLRPLVGRLSLAQTAGVLEGLLAALSHAESMRIVHRDVKPENLLVTAEGGIKIADFGIAKAVQQVATEEMLTPAGATVGTPAYMAPEQAMAQEIGPWTDLYQTGVVAYELLSGTVPFTATGAPLAVMMKHISEPVPALEGADPAIEAWVQRMLAKDPGDRPASAHQAWNALEELILDALGPLWRRDARLSEPDPTVEHAKPLTPAHFSSWQDYVPPGTAQRAAPPPPPPDTPARPATPPPPTPPPPAEPTPTGPVSTPEPAPPPAPTGPLSTPPPAADPAPTRALAAAAPPPAERRPRGRFGLVAGGALVLAALVVAALLLIPGGDDDGDPTPTPTPTATATASPTPTASPTVAAGPFPVGAGPDGIAIGADAVWVAASRDGTLTRIDPATGETASVDVGKNPDGVIVALGAVWVSLTDEDKVAKVSDDANPRLLEKIDVGSKPEGLAASSRAVWVANSGDGSLTQILASGETRTVTGVGSTPVDVAIGAGAVWVADSAGGVVRVDGGTRRPVTTVRGIGPNPRSLVIVDRDVWVATAGDGRVWRIDADANQAAGSVRVGGQPRDVATDGEHLWVTDREGDRVVEIDPAERAVVGDEPVPGGPLEVAVDERAVWVSAFDSGAVTRLGR